MSTPALLERLKAKGYKLTSQRRKIIETLHRSGHRASARDIYHLLRQSKSAISLDTVYRNLRLLAEIGIVHQISLQSGAVFELTHDGRHHHHLICVDCEKVVCIPFCPESFTYTEQATDAGFDVLGHMFEVYGRCDDCQK
jgi:Fe2+ or Zn2+ uptake regulation protein